MSYAILGNIPFSTSASNTDPYIIFEGHNTFQTFNEEDEATYAIHQLINTKARLQPTGLELKKINFTLHLRQEYVNVKNAVEQIRQMRETFAVVPLIWGNGDVVGNFVITKTSKEINYQFNDGAIVGATLSVELLEYYYEDSVSIIKKEEADNRKKAKAVGGKKSVTKARTNKGTCAQDVTLYIRYMRRNGALLTDIIIKYTLINQQTQVYTKNIKEAADRMSELPCLNLEQRDRCYDISNRCTTIDTILVSGNDRIEQQRQVRILNKMIEELQTACKDLMTQSITRNG